MNGIKLPYIKTEAVVFQGEAERDFNTFYMCTAQTRNVESRFKK